MVCLNCQSTDIVQIQGQNYCINCGDMVVETKTEAIESPASEAVVSTPEPEKKQETYQAQAVAISAVVEVPDRPKSLIKRSTDSFKSVAPILATFAQAKPPKITSPLVVSRPLDLRDARLKPVKPTIAAPAIGSGRRMNDLSSSRVAIRQTTKPLPETSKKIMETTKKPSVTPLIATKHKSVKASKKQETSLLFALRALTNRQYLPAAILLGLLYSIPSALLTFLIDPNIIKQLQVNGLRGIDGNTLGNLVAISAIGLFVAILGYGYSLYVGSAIAYGASKQLDGRHIPRRRWFDDAFQSIPGLIGLDAIVVTLAICLVGLEVLLVQYGPVVQQASLRIGVIFLLNIFVVYAALGLVLARLLGGYCVVLAGKRSVAAFTIGWKLYHKRLVRLIGALGLSLIVEIIIWLPYLLFTQNIGRNLTEGYRAELTAVLVGAAVGLSLIFASLFWLRQYHDTVRATYPSSYARLISGRRIADSAGGLTAILAGLMLIVAAGLLVCLVYLGNITEALQRVLS